MRAIYIAIFLLLSITLHAYQYGDVVVTKEGDKGIVYYIDQEKVLLMSFYEKETQFYTRSSFYVSLAPDNVISSVFNPPYLFNGLECTKRMIELSKSSDHVFPILESVPVDRGWFIPSYAEMLQFYLSISGMSLDDIIIAMGGDGFNHSYWTTSQSDGSVVVVGKSSRGLHFTDGKAYVRPIYQINLADETDESQITYLWNTGSTETQITDSPKSTTTYTVTATNTLTACKSTASRKVLVAGEPQEIYETICEGETYSGYGFKENTTGTYTKSVGEQNCITEVSLHLTVAPKYKQVFDDVACMGQYYNKHGFSLTPFVKGAFHDTLSFISQLGCDSTVILNLNVKPTTYDTITRRICQDETYKDPDFDIEANHRAGLTYYTVEKTNEEGCRAYHTLALQVDSVYQVTTLATVEEGAAYNQQGFNIDKVIPGNAYRLELNAVNGCDSIVTLYFRMLHGEEIGPNPNPNPNPEGEGLKDNRIIPTAFTPHFEDDMNDHFMLGYEVYIYDRYGNLICHSENGWDGTYRGKVATPGVYVYTVFMKDGEIRKGTIEVVKSK
ncbi:MAG: gliding motility-associated C-terminal domain-containing protein [Paludibacteraceae bacterium]|nr:gliding motility-associated C-terminal domain-containing protein [Paludibacteraceae bacterium]